MIPFLMAAVLSAAALAQSQAGAQSPSAAQTQPAGGSGVPSIAIPKTTEVIVIETPKQGVTPQQVTAVIPEEIKASFTSTGKSASGIRAAMAKVLFSWSTRKPRTRH